MKKTNKVNALTFFNNNKATNIKNANNTMKVFKKSLTKADDGKIIGPQNKGETNNGYWFNNTEKRAMADAKSRYGASRTRDNNNDPNAEKEYGDLIKNYQPIGPVIPLENQVAELNKKYPYSEGFEEVPFKGGYNNKGWADEYRKANKEPYYKEKALLDPYPNVGTGFIKRKGGFVKSKNK
jgi:hypothetical protein